MAVASRGSISVLGAVAVGIRRVGVAASPWSPLGHGARTGTAGSGLGFTGGRGGGPGRAVLRQVQFGKGVTGRLPLGDHRAGWRRL